MIALAVKPIATPTSTRLVVASLITRRAGDAGCSSNVANTTAAIMKSARPHASIKYSGQCARSAFSTGAPSGGDTRGGDRRARSIGKGAPTGAARIAGIGVAPIARVARVEDASASVNSFEPPVSTHSEVLRNLRGAESLGGWSFDMELVLAGGKIAHRAPARRSPAASLSNCSTRANVVARGWMRVARERFGILAEEARALCTRGDARFSASMARNRRAARASTPTAAAVTSACTAPAGR